MSEPQPDGGSATTLDGLLSRSAALSRDLIVDGPGRLSGQRIERQVQVCAGGLVERGVGHGDAVAWQLPNCWQSIVLLRACWRIGAVAVPLHHRLEPDEAARNAAHAGATLLDTTDLPRGAPVLSGTRPVGAGDRAVVLFTSGSSGRPKGVVHPHRSLVHKARQMPQVHGLHERDVVLMPAPLGHISGVLNGVLVPGAVPFRAVLLQRWDADAAADLIEREGVTFMVGPPTFFLDLDATGKALTSLRLISCGGAGVTPEFCMTMAERFGAVVKRTYGSTEAPTVATARVGDPPERAWHHDGRATPGTDLSVDEHGELLVRGPEVCDGYLADDDHGAIVPATNDDGWFATGDLAGIDKDGWLRITGRVGDGIIRGGENIAPAELEGVLTAHDAVTDAIVVGVADRRLGQRVGALVVSDAAFGLDECRRWFAERGVARFRWPEYLAHVNAIPRLASGKPDRRRATALLEHSIRPGGSNPPDPTDAAPPPRRT